MKYSNQSIWRVLSLFTFVVSSVNCIFAQQWVVDEIAEENEGGPFSGFGCLGLFSAEIKRKNLRNSLTRRIILMIIFTTLI